MIQMLYEYNTEYTTEQYTTYACYNEDKTSTGKTWLSFNMSIVSQVAWPNGEGVGFTIQELWVRPAVGKKNFSFCKLASAPCSSRTPLQMKSTITLYRHPANTLFQIKVR